MSIAHPLSSRVQRDIIRFRRTAGLFALLVFITGPRSSAAEASKAAPAGTPAALKEGNMMEAPALSAEEQLKRFKVPDGFIIELVASEVDGAAKPTAITFDAAGRLWCTTATAYPRDLSPEVWGQPGPDRILVMEVVNASRKVTPRVFADRMMMPMGVLPERNYAYVAEGPEIVRLEDTDGDGRADKRKVLLHGFGVQDTHTLPHQIVPLPGGRLGFAQGLLNDGVVFDAEGRAYPFPRTLMASMTRQGTELRIHSAGLNNIWGRDQDALGRTFIHEANDFGYSVIPFEADSSYPSFIDAKIHPDAPMHPPTAEGLELGGTGFCGLAILDDRSGSFPAPWHGNIFVANPITGKVHAVAGTENAMGVWQFTRNGDLVTCDDPMFRPVAIMFGPDGCLYIADWYNRIISHNEVARDHPGRDKQHGRIWRVRHQAQPRAIVRDYDKASREDLLTGLKSERRWDMRAAWQQITLRQDKSLLPMLIKLATDAAAPMAVRIHAFWSLEALGHFEPKLWQQFLASPDYNLRREAVRALSSLRIAPAVADPLLRALAEERTWTVRYEALRYLRLASADLPAWTKGWRAEPATRTEVKGWKGPYLALDGSYQRAFQEFLFRLVETKTQLPQGMESRWNSVLPRDTPPLERATVEKRVAEVKAHLAKADAKKGRGLVEGLCLTCHSLEQKGIGFAPPLDGSGNRDAEALITAIVHADAAIENVFRLFRITTKDGETVEGFKQSEIRNRVSLRFMGGGERSVAFPQIATAGYIENRSVMPDFGATLPPADIAHIVAYLATQK
jgi:putative membrane-bound dehydrogenase-like protein